MAKVEHKPVLLLSEDSKSDAIRDFGRAVDTLNVDINRSNEPQRRPGMVRRLDDQQGGVVRLLFSYAGLCSRNFDLLGGGGLISIHGEYWGGILPPFVPAGISIDETQPTTPTPDILPLSEFVALGGGSIHMEWRFNNGTKIIPYGAQAVVIMRRAGADPESIDDEEATEVYRGLDTSFIDEEVDDAQTYHYGAWVLYTTGISTALIASVLTDIIFVDINAPAGGNGESWDTAFQNPQDAVDGYAAGGQIWMTDGTYGLPPSSSASVLDTTGKDFTGIPDMTIHGGVISGSLILSQDLGTVVTTMDGTAGSSHTFSFTGPRLVMSGVSFAGVGGSTDRNININTGSDVTIDISNCKFTGPGCRFSRISGFITLSAFSTCTSTTIGGGIRADASVGGALGISSCDFTDCSSGSGGAVFVQDCDISDCTFLRCSSSATGHGGAVELNAGTNSIDGCDFTECTSLVDGGALRIQTKAAISSCTFTRCTAVSNGGAIEIDDDNITARADVTIDDCRFISCSAKTGGAIVSESDAGAIITKCTFTGCEATSGRGGGIHDEGGAVGISVTGSTFASCVAGSDGGGMFLGSVPSVQSGNAFSGNVPNDVGP